MHKHLDRNAVKTAEKSVRNVGVIAVMRDKTAITTAYAKERKTLVKDAAQMLRVTEIIEEPAEKTAKSRDRLIAMDLFRATTKPTTVIAAIIAIAADTNRAN
jgi:murein endopeptidase